GAAHRQGGPYRRPRAHPARRYADGVRPGAGHPVRAARDRRRPRRRLRQDGGPARDRHRPGTAGGGDPGAEDRTAGAVHRGRGVLRLSARAGVRDRPRPGPPREATVHTIAVIGAGKIGEVLLSGLLRAGWPGDRLALAEEMFRPLGRTIRVPESQQDAVTALSGSGPAYFYFLVEAMTDAGILLGLPRQAAHDLIVQTAIGSAIMLRDSGEHQ